MTVERGRSHDLPAWWIEAVVLLSVYFAYTATRGAADSSAFDAVALGWDLQRFSEAVHIDVELGLNRWLLGVPVLAVVSCYYYATLHFIVTPAVLFWMHRHHPQHYIQARWTIVFTTLIALAGFFAFPTAPPRLLDNSGYIDTMAHFAGWGWWSGTSSAAPDGLDSLANQYAALPSLHCAWALWCGFLLVRYARRRLVRILGGLYPAATVFVVMGTANHYLVDAFAGWAVLGVAAFAAAAVVRGRSRGSAGCGPAAGVQPSSPGSAPGSSLVTRKPGPSGPPRSAPRPSAPGPSLREQPGTPHPGIAMRSEEAIREEPIRQEPRTPEKPRSAAFGSMECREPPGSPQVAGVNR